MTLSGRPRAGIRSVITAILAITLLLPFAGVARGEALPNNPVAGMAGTSSAAQDTAQGTRPTPAATAPASPDAGAQGLLPDDLSPWSMFLGADVIVKAVMIGLALASVVTWTIWLAKSLELLAARRRLRRAFAVIGAAANLDEANERLICANGVGRALLHAATDEWHRSREALNDHDGLKERVASLLERIEAANGRSMTRGTGVLATIGATAPFVGLFGTVWGIMNSFIGISQAHTTNLAVVAPGIAEALLATACGLIAAIPAVVIYNHFARQVTAYRALVGDTAAAVLRIVSRDLSHGGGQPVPNRAGVSRLRMVME